MKHKFIRAGAVLLALVLLLGAMPTALATGNDWFDPSHWGDDWWGYPGYSDTITVQADSDQLVLDRGSAVTTVRVQPPYGYSLSDLDITMEVTDGGYYARIDDNGAFRATRAGDYTVKVTAVFHDRYTSASVTRTERCTIHVYDSDYRVSIDPTELVLPVGETRELNVTVLDPTGNPMPGSAYEITWSNGGSYADVYASGTYCRVTGYQAGTVDITAKVTIGSKSYQVSCEVKVTSGELTCSVDRNSAPLDRVITLHPSMTSGTYFQNVTYKYQVVAGSAKIEDNAGSWFNPNTADVSATKPGVVKIRITAYSGNTELASTDVTVSFYDSVTLDATLKNDAKTVSFSNKDVFTRVKYNGETITSRFGSLANYMTTVSRPQDYYIDFSVASSSKGTLTGPMKNLRNIPMSRLGEMKFTPAGGVFQADYTVYDADSELPVSQGTLTLRSTLLAGDIIYSTDYETAITLEEEKFEDFWAEATGKSKSSLSYVTFSPSSSDWGTLYTKLNGDKVTERMMFEPNYRVSSRNYDLDAVTYVPYKNKLTSYSDTVDFTAYGLDGTTVEGQVVIYLNSNAGTSITSRGVVFGKANLTKVLQETFLQNRDADLAYVTFYLPEAEEGTLYYNFTSALDKNLVRSDRQYYVDPDKNDKSQYSLDLVAFVPAAGTYGKVTLYYKGFDKTGDISYSGALTLTVNQKDASAAFSDITARSYSWAADSVDFLYYEDIAKGSNGKYNPGSSITRGDFMLMLYRAFLQSDYEDYKVTSNFSDVTKGSTSYSKETYQAVGVAKYLGIAKGSGGKFNPNSPITREEAMTLIYRTMDEIDWTLSYESYARASSFSDYGSVSSYAKDAITELVSHGVILGNNGKITPKSNITRAEMACILHRVLTY